MSLRLIISPQPTNVVPLRSSRKVNQVVDERPPNPRSLSDLVVVALRLDRPVAGDHCESCRREGA
jgi:hypothetical protein